MKVFASAFSEQVADEQTTTGPAVGTALATVTAQVCGASRMKPTQAS